MKRLKSFFSLLQRRKVSMKNWEEIRKEIQELYQSNEKPWVIGYSGGKGDIEKGMILVRRNLLFAAIFQPKYWMMENVPRLESALGKV